MFESISVLGLLIAALVGMILGIIWYSPKIGFGVAWMRLSGVPTDKPPGAVMVRSMIFGFAAQLVTAYVLAIVLRIAGASTVADALIIGGVVWLGFMAAQQIGMVLWDGKPLTLFFINTGYELVRILAMALVLISVA